MLSELSPTVPLQSRHPRIRSNLWSSSSIYRPTTSETIEADRESCFLMAGRHTYSYLNDEVVLGGWSGMYHQDGYALPKTTDQATKAKVKQDSNDVALIYTPSREHCIAWYGMAWHAWHAWLAYYRKAYQTKPGFPRPPTHPPPNMQAHTLAGYSDGVFA